MKMMKWALLGGAALAVTATAARADDLSALKAQIEALQTRVSQLEAQPQAAQPSIAGYSLMAFRDGQGTFEGELPGKYGDSVRDSQGFTMSVMPTADVAPVAEVSVSGEIRTVGRSRRSLPRIEKSRKPATSAGFASTLTTCAAGGASDLTSTTKARSAASSPST